MPIVIGGGQYNVGLKYMDEMARLRSEAMRQQSFDLQRQQQAVDNSWRERQAQMQQEAELRRQAMQQRNFDLNRQDQLAQQDWQHTQAQDQTGYQRGRDVVMDNRYDALQNYQHGRDTLGDQRWQTQFDLNKQDRTAMQEDRDLERERRKQQDQWAHQDRQSLQEDRDLDREVKKSALTDKAIEREVAPIAREVLARKGKLENLRRYNPEMSEDIDAEMLQLDRTLDNAVAMAQARRQSGLADASDSPFKAYTPPTQTEGAAPGKGGDLYEKLAAKTTAAKQTKAVGEVMKNEKASYAMMKKRLEDAGLPPDRVEEELKATPTGQELSEYQDQLGSDKSAREKQQYLESNLAKLVGKLPVGWQNNPNLVADMEPYIQQHKQLQMAGGPAAALSPEQLWQRDMMKRPKPSYDKAEVMRFLQNELATVAPLAQQEAADEAERQKAIAASTAKAKAEVYGQRPRESPMQAELKRIGLEKKQRDRLWAEDVVRQKALFGDVP